MVGYYEPTAQSAVIRKNFPLKKPCSDDAEQGFLLRRFCCRESSRGREDLIIECGSRLNALNNRGAGVNDPGYSTSEANSPSATRVRILIFGRTDATVRMSLPRSSVVML